MNRVMKAERGVFIGASMSILLTATDAFASGDPNDVDLTAAVTGFAVFQVLLAAVMFVSRQPLKRRFRFAAFYLLSIVATWIVGIILNIGPGWWVSYVITVPFISLITFRYLLTHRIDGTWRADP